MITTSHLPPSKPLDPLEKRVFPVTGMSCAACAGSVESILSRLDGVESATVNFASGTVQVIYRPDIQPDDLRSALRPLGYELVLTDSPALQAGESLRLEHLQKVRARAIRTTLLSLPVFIIGMFFMHWMPGRWISLGLSAVVLFVFGREYFIHAFRQARYRRANMDTLVALSTGIAFAYSAGVTIFPWFFRAYGLSGHVYFEAATVIVSFVSIGKWMEEKAKYSTSTAIRKLIGLQPKTVQVIRDGIELNVPIAAVARGEIVQVRPGERIPLDGRLTEGQSYVDESMITGEPIPASKLPGDATIAGTMNQKGSFRFRVEKAEGETMLCKIIQMVQDAQGSKAPVQKLADKIAGIFVPVVLGIAVLTFAAWMIWGGEAGFSLGFQNAIAVLVIACPCALGLATPTATTVGIGKGATQQVLIKNAESLETGARVDVLVLDKTGTITEGKPLVKSVSLRKGGTSSRQKAILQAMETRSEHPLAEAIAAEFAAFRDPGIQLEQVGILPGLGIRAVVQGQTYTAGNLALMEASGVAPGEFQEAVDAGQAQGHTVVCFAEGKEMQLVLGIADKLKPGSREAIEKLQGMGMEVFMLTGDHPASAAAVAGEVGIKRFKAGVLPSEKAEFVQELQQEGYKVAMVGDGINDSGALARADLSIAMGTGSDIAIDVARVTLMSSDLNSIVTFLKLSRKTVSTIRMNLFWAFIYNLAGIPIAAGLLFPFTGFLLDPMIAGAAMALSSVSVVLNSLRLKLVKI